jgi:hypothetical protein
MHASFRFLASAGIAAGLALSTSVAHAQDASGISAVWAAEGGDKVLQHERRAAQATIRNSVWDGTKITLFGARNEVVNFNLVIESEKGARDLSVAFNRLQGPGNTVIASTNATGDGVFSWTNRPIELFVVRYLQIKGLSKLSYETYDERHVPSKMRRPTWDEYGRGSGTWADRPGADKFFPEIAVPHELQPTFTIAANQNQSVWGDVYIPLSAKAGTYTGTLTIRSGTTTVRSIPVSLQVRDFSLPQQPTAKTMVYSHQPFVGERYVGQRWPDPNTDDGRKLRAIMQKHWQILRRHKITPLIEEGTDGGQPSPESIERLNGSLYTTARGFDGPGRGEGDNVYGIGVYGHWDWKNGDQALYNQRTDAWENWFAKNAPGVERFLYLTDEPDLRNDGTRAEINGWLDKLAANPGPGKNLRTLLTASTQKVQTYVPRVNVAANWYEVADTAPFQAAVDKHMANPRNAQYQYNGKRPASGSFAVEDDGVALRMVPWTQWKKGISRWFFWESTYYFDFQTKGQQVNVWTNPNTYGTDSYFDPVVGRSGFNYSNGDGVLLYPGTDKVFPEVSLGVNGPIASLRLKYWRRGIQDADYVALANAADPVRTREIVNRMVPKVLWEVGVETPDDPTWKRTDISWSIDPEQWESARRQLADIIEAASKPKKPAATVR